MNIHSNEEESQVVVMEEPPLGSCMLSSFSEGCDFIFDI